MYFTLNTPQNVRLQQFLQSPATGTFHHGRPANQPSAIQTRVDSLSQILSNSVNANTTLSKPESDAITAELNSAIHHILINGAALIAASNSNRRSNGDDFAIVELDVMELTVEESHTCAICGKGFKRDANLRMHMRAHGDQFKTLESLSKPNNLKNSDDYDGRKTRFSCPYGGCNRNRKHRDFRALKSVVSAKNHFKRSHCPKKYCCCRCKNKRFSLLSDLKSHMKHCNAVQVEDDKLLKMKMNDDSNLNVVEDEDEDEEENGGFEIQLDLWSSIEDLVHF